MPISTPAADDTIYMEYKKNIVTFYRFLHKGDLSFMNTKKHVEFRYYEIPSGDLVFPLTGDVWNKAYGEGKDKLHFHNYYEVGHCYAGEGEMILGETEYSFYPGCVSLIPTKELHTTNTFGKTAGWEWMYFDMHDVLKKLYPDDEILRENIGHELDKAGRFLTPDMNIKKLTFFIRGIFSEMQNKEYMYRDMVSRFLLMLVVEIIRKVQKSELPERGNVSADIFPAIDYVKNNYASRIYVVDLAHSCGLSESYFRKIFERYMNMKPMEYVNFVRIQKGCILLRETSLSAALISDKVGFENVSTFIRNFKRIIGCTPNKWRTDEEYAKNKFMKYNVTALKGWLE